jgi:hypothetical protein
MLTAVEESEFLYEWDLQNIDISQVLVSPEFSFQESMFCIRIKKKGESLNYGCHLESVEILNKPGRIHFRFDLLKRLDNSVTKSCQLQYELKEFYRGWGPSDWIDSATTRDHIVKLKMWTSEYDFEYDLEKININNPSFPDPFFVVGENKLRVLLKKNEGGAKFGCYLEDVDSAISSKVRFQIDLFKRLDNRLVKSDKCDFSFIKTDVGFMGRGFEDWFDVDSIRDHVLKVKVLLIKPLSDFVEKPIGFESHGYFLFNKMCSNLSFQINDEVVVVLHGILTSRSDYFRAMLEGCFKEAQVPMTVESKISIHGIDVDVFKMIIEWIYTMDIKSLNEPFSPTLLLDLQV